MSGPSVWCWLYALLHSFGTVISVVSLSINTTVDDMDDQIQYSPSGSWNIGPDCDTCQVQPNAAQAYHSSWHDATFDPSDSKLSMPQSIAFSFTGTAIYVFGIFCHNSSNPTTGQSYFLYLDGNYTGRLSFAPPAAGGEYFIYNYLLFSSGTLSNGPHSFELQNGQLGGVASLVLFDYLIYTHDVGSVDPTTTSSVLMTPSIASATDPIGSVIGTTSSDPLTQGSPSSSTSLSITAQLNPTVTSTVTNVSVTSIGSIVEYITSTTGPLSSTPVSNVLSGSDSSSTKHAVILIAGITSSVVGLCICTGVVWFWRCSRHHRRTIQRFTSMTGSQSAVSFGSHPVIITHPVKTQETGGEAEPISSSRLSAYAWGSGQHTSTQIPDSVSRSLEHLRHAHSRSPSHISPSLLSKSVYEGDVPPPAYRASPSPVPVSIPCHSIDLTWD
ncbi:hypothetical protein PHLGIDRAFT_201496 [Phlebiopsis gigantea 11061_1 CR5-6]|uniref:Uncharacterized protein n=1 Tax=Phlebiopsis gigantea (strain 11061_1 CR5-6) TaxID=745531 RepID=A0A0C3S3B7_PHLG1|nr:hypothetical protein PHLGIDRAFT_201496 [Phlebiopsis gigantea 11061_1 CR5-6]